MSLCNITHKVLGRDAMHGYDGSRRPSILAEGPDTPCGVTAAELVERSPHRNGSTPLSPGELERWLLEEGFAESDGLRLVPTDRAFALVKALTWLSSPTRYGPERPA